jgi:hypothetical protein
VQLGREHSYAVSSIVRASVWGDPPNIIAHGPVLVLVKPAFPPRTQYHCDRHEDDQAYYADQHDEAL